MFDPETPKRNIHIASAKKLNGSSSGSTKLTSPKKLDASHSDSMKPEKLNVMKHASTNAARLTAGPSKHRQSSQETSSTAKLAGKKVNDMPIQHITSPEHLLSFYARFLFLLLRFIASKQHQHQSNPHRSHIAAKII